MKYTISAIRKNLPNKPDYPWQYRYADNQLITFNSKDDALMTIDRLKSSLDGFPLYQFDVVEEAS